MAPAASGSYTPAFAPLRGIAPSWSSCRRRMASSRRLPCLTGGSSCSAGRWLMTCSTTSPSTEEVKWQQVINGHQSCSKGINFTWLPSTTGGLIKAQLYRLFLPVATYPRVGTKCSSAMFSRPGTRRW